MSSTRKKTLSKQQRLRRADGRIVRLEVSLNAENTGDVFISDCLSELPDGVTKSDYLRSALLDKIMSERHETDTDKEIAALRAEIGELKMLIVELAHREIKVQMVQAAQVTVGSVESPTVEQSGGINMTRSRPAKPLARIPVVEQQEEEIEITDEYLAMLGKRMAQSVRNANPGKQI